MNKIVYKWNEYPIEICLGKENWFNIDKYEIVGETNHYIRVRKINDDILPDRRITRKYSKKEFNPVYETHKEAVDALEKLLLYKIKLAEESLTRRHKEYNMFYLQFYGS